MRRTTSCPSARSKLLLESECGEPDFGGPLGSVAVAEELVDSSAQFVAGAEGVAAVEFVFDDGPELGELRVRRLGGQCQGCVGTTVTPRACRPARRLVRNPGGGTPMTTSSPWSSMLMVTLPGRPPSAASRGIASERRMMR